MVPVNSRAAATSHQECHPIHRCKFARDAWQGGIGVWPKRLLQHHALNMHLLRMCQCEARFGLSVVYIQMQSVLLASISLRVAPEQSNCQHELCTDGQV